MGELLLCNEQIAAMPYYIDGISLNVYSIEELNYYILNNIYLIDSEFMNEELCKWLEKELGLRELADELLNVIYENGKLSTFVEIILRKSFYLNPPQIDELVSVLAQMEEKSDFEVNKMRADRLMEKEKYLSSIYAYKHLLNSEEATAANPIVVGNIYHNLGTAYARLFMFREAIEYYKLAYDKNHDRETLKEWLFAYRCLKDDDSFLQVAMEHGLDDMQITELKNELSMYSRNQEIKDFEELLSKFAEEINQGERNRFCNEADKILNGWKDEYRRICRV
ncbi:MAG: hypothetical protein E7282_10300 [Lachnospiraceae bacterium]|nr:hypothetical protein [Lachnospiraceae bacterium]